MSEGTFYFGLPAAVQIIFWHLFFSIFLTSDRVSVSRPNTKMFFKGLSVMIAVKMPLVAYGTQQKMNKVKRAVIPS